MTSNSPAGEMLDALVVGAGPTGMMAAACLVKMGAKVRLIDKAPLRSDKSRALLVQARTLELFQRFGFADSLIARGRTSVQVEWYVGKRSPLKIDLGDTGIEDSPYPFLLFVSQVETERVLEDFLRAQGVEVERPRELISFTQDANSIEANLRGADGAIETVRARYLIGADGAHSAVRKGAGMKFEGAPYRQNFVLADCDVDWDLPEGVLRLFLSERGILVAFPMPGTSRYRVVVAEGRGAAAEGDPTLEETQLLASKLSSVPLRLHRASWLARFHLHHRGADRYRNGRVFIAGDAAHIHSPAGGQGMNTGLQDAMNLCWKLGMVLRGFPGEELLESYAAERMPVGKNLLRSTDRIFSLAASRNRWLLWLRDLFLPHVVPRVMGSRKRRARVMRFISQLSVSYPKSDVVARDEPGFSGGPRPGTRAPDGPVLLPDGSSSTLFTELARATFSKHQIVLFGEPEADLLLKLRALRADWIEVLPLRDTALLRERYGVTGSAIYLLRPDGVVAFRAASFGLASLETFLQQIC